MQLEKQQTGIASEYYVAGELSRLGYDVTVTFGNTKSIDLLVHKNDEVFIVQVKGIQESKSICWNLNKTKLTAKKKIILVLVNLHCNEKKLKPEFFILRQEEALTLFKDTPREGPKRAYLDYNKIKKQANLYQDRWSVFENNENAIL